MLCIARMGRIRVTCGPRLGERQLGYSMLVGRHWSCDVLLPHEEAPLRWIELRWFLGRWGWRALSREGDTIGPSTWLRPGWRVLDPKDRATRLVRLREVAQIELIDGSAPKPHAIDLQSGRTLMHDALLDALATMGMHQWRTPAGDPLRDGAVIVVGGRPLRLHLPQQAMVQPSEALSILHPDTILKIDRDTLDGAFEVGPARIELAAEMVRVLIPYAEARTNEYVYEDGWMTREETYERWKELGGNPSSPSQRIGWMRGKLKTYLARRGLQDVESLFESQRVGQWYANRLGLQPEQIVVG